MKYGLDHAQMVATDRIFLDLKNDRHEPYDSQEQVIAYLCKDEHILELAKDISKHGLNQLELFALIPRDPTNEESTPSFVVAEGNRRMCVLKLLTDPDLAPADKRKDFQRLALDWMPISKVFSAVFKKEADVKLWVDRIHLGPQGGIGRKTWNADQKQRRSGNSNNMTAQAVLDYAETAGILAKEDRKGKLTTATRYLRNPLLREAMGIKSVTPEEITLTRPGKDFDVLVKRFTTDLLNDVVHSRSNKNEVDAYSRELSATKGMSGQRTEPQSISVDNSTFRQKKKSIPPKKPKNIQYIPFNDDLNIALKAMPSYKLGSIYHSLCNINLPDHTPLLAVGMWCFLETLTTWVGRNDKTDFHAFLSSERLYNMGLGSNRDTKSLRDVIKRISDHGNSTKHHKIAAALNSNQLANDIDVMGEMLVKLAEQAKGKARE